MITNFFKLIKFCYSNGLAYSWFSFINLSYFMFYSFYLFYANILFIVLNSNLFLFNDNISLFYLRHFFIYLFVTYLHISSLYSPNEWSFEFMSFLILDKTLCSVNFTFYLNKLCYIFLSLNITHYSMNLMVYLFVLNSLYIFHLLLT